MNEPIKAKIVETPKLPRRYIGVKPHLYGHTQTYDTTRAYGTPESVKQCHGFRDMTLYELPGSDEVPWTEERLKEFIEKYWEENDYSQAAMLEFAKRLGVI